MSAELCIMLLTCSDRHFMFPKIVEQLNKSTYLNKIILLVLTHHDDIDFYNEVLKNTNIQYNIVKFDEDYNYLNKIAFTLDFTKKHNIPYIMKHDNDILCGAPLYDYLFENLNVLQNTDNILLTPTLTSGIPTVDQFVNDYLNKDEQNIMFSLFKEYKFDIIGNVDYTPLNKQTIEASSWNHVEYYNNLSNLNHHFKGMHPIRVYEKAIKTLNEIVIKYKNKILNKDNYSLIYDNKTPYFCNSIFCIKTDIYNTIINTRSLYVDNFDEVPLNKWRDIHKQNLVIVKFGTAIHFMYNSIINNIPYEKSMTQLL